MKNFFQSMLGSLAALFVFSGLSVFIMIAIAVGIAASSTQEQVPETKENTVLELRLQGQIVDRLSEEDMLFANFTFPGQEDVINSQSLNDILKSIIAARTDNNIEGIYVRASAFSAGFSTCKEIRDELERFKESGKFIVSYADNYSQKAYYIASVADKVYMNPQGMLDLHGLSTSTTFLKKTLAKIGVEMTVIKHGKYKAAVEPFTSDKMSEASKEQTSRLLDVVWNIYCNEVAASRKLNSEMMNLYADKMMAMQKPELCVNYKLVDKLLYYDQMEDELKKISNREGKKLRRLLTTKYAKTVSLTTETDDKVAVIYAIGAIDGGGEGINSKSLIEDIREAREDEDVKAIVLRINSPGGSAYGSEQIWREVTLAREGKPFIVSMGDVAASGGYYIACAAHSIIAQPTTITGSIGIFGMFPNVEKLSEKVGLTFDITSTNKMADFMNPTREVSAQEKRMLQNYIDRGYQTFITRCADGRQMTTEAIDKIGEGRVWTGVDAKDLGLVDKLGSLDDAIGLAAEMSGMETFEIEEYPKAKPLIETLVESLQGEVKTSIGKVKYGEAYKLYQYAEKVQGMQGIQARMPFELEVY